MESKCDHEGKREVVAPQWLRLLGRSYVWKVGLEGGGRFRRPLARLSPRNRLKSPVRCSRPYGRTGTPVCGRFDAHPPYQPQTASASVNRRNRRVARPGGGNCRNPETRRRSPTRRTVLPWVAETGSHPGVSAAGRTLITAPSSPDVPEGCSQWECPPGTPQRWAFQHCPP